MESVQEQINTIVAQIATDKQAQEDAITKVLEEVQLLDEATSVNHSTLAIAQQDIFELTAKINVCQKNISELTRYQQELSERVATLEMTTPSELKPTEIDSLKSGLAECNLKLNTLAQSWNSRSTVTEGVTLPTRSGPRLTVGGIVEREKPTTNE
jgi:predicted RNase H-like nuclease (RuvC/YqgF family)